MDKLLGVISSTFKLDEETLSQFKDEAGTWLSEDEIAGKLPGILSAKLKALGETKFKEGDRRRAVNFEKWAKSKGFQNPDGLQGEEFFAAFAEHLESTTTTGGDGQAEITKETAAKHPVVKALITEQLQAARQAIEAKEREFNEYKQQSEKQRVQDVAKREALNALRTGKVRLSVDGADESERLETIYLRLERENIGLDSNGKPVLLKDGEPLVDEWGKQISFEKYVADLGGRLYGRDDFDPSKGSPSPGRNGQQSQPTGNANKWGFKSQSDVDNYLASETDGIKRMEARKAWAEQLDAQANK